MIWLKQNWIKVLVATLVSGALFFIRTNSNPTVLVNNQLEFLKKAQIVTPEVLIPTDRKLKVDEVFNILNKLNSWGEESEEKSAFVQKKMQKIWDNLGITLPSSESKWSSWDGSETASKYPKCIGDVKLDERDIFNWPSREKFLILKEDCFSNFRLLIFNNNGEYVDSLGYLFQKYDPIEFWPLPIGNSSYLAVEHMLGGGSGTATYALSIYEFDKENKIRRVLANIPWHGHGEPSHEVIDGKEVIGRYTFNTDIDEAKMVNNMPELKIGYLYKFEPHVKSDWNRDLGDLVVENALKEKYALNISGSVIYKYSGKLGQFITSDPKWKTLGGRFHDEF